MQIYSLLLIGLLLAQLYISNSIALFGQRLNNFHFSITKILKSLITKWKISLLKKDSNKSSKVGHFPF
jgi:hypothetical protein